MRIYYAGSTHVNSRMEEGLLQRAKEGHFQLLRSHARILVCGLDSAKVSVQLFVRGIFMKQVCSFVVYSILLATVLAMTGCATFLNDDNQMVTFNTTPEGAQVAIDGVAKGYTPVVLPVARKGGDKVVTFTLSGYKTVNYELKNVLSGALVGNILLGGGIGLIVDAVSGRGGGYQKDVSVLLERGYGTISTGTKDQKKKKKDSKSNSASSHTSYW